ncbi:MAG TPA: hypothetical protein VJ802_07665 [Gemmatimonadaceae bacterium]|nr:hypothetical protein [Gemmatimonadaceae bacterium]
MPISLWVVAALLLGGTSALAQDPKGIADSITCTYDTCALRFEGRHVLRGLAGHRVLSLGMWGATPLVPFASRSDSGVTHAAEFDRLYTPGARWSTLGSLGLAVTGTLLALHGELPELSENEGRIYFGGFALSLVLFTHGERRVNRAIHALSRAIWWTNRDLAR